MSGFKELNIYNEHRPCEGTDPQLTNKLKKINKRKENSSEIVSRIQKFLRPASLSFTASVRVTEYELCKFFVSSLRLVENAL